MASASPPWAEWKHGRPLTQKQLGGLLRPFGIVSETVSIPGFNDAKGYKRDRFEAAWEPIALVKTLARLCYDLMKARPTRSDRGRE
jgi:Protein of unknown function (DUF3631)